MLVTKSLRLFKKVNFTQRLAIAQTLEEFMFQLDLISASYITVLMIRELARVILDLA